MLNNLKQAMEVGRMKAIWEYLGGWRANLRQQDFEIG